jgi:hypothetical protein
MMDTHTDNELIEKYRKSDFSDRIFLFLDHRDLRSEFSAIDTADAEKQNSHIFKPDWLSSMKRVWQEIFSTSKPSSESVE